MTGGTPDPGVRHGTVLVVDDDPDFTAFIRFLLEGAGHSVHEASDLAAAKALLSKQNVDLCLLDYQLGSADGLQLIGPLRALAPQMPIALLTAHGDPKLVVEAMQRGAADFLTKPVDEARLTATLAHAIRERDLSLEVARLRGRDSDTATMVGQSAAMLAVRRAIDAVAPTDATVLVTGESGTGKELVATAIHAGSARSNRAFVALNMAALPRDLAEATLFGHEKGAFTGASERRGGACAQADGGTLFLDEIGEMPLDLQSKILRFLQEGTYRSVGGDREQRADVRIVSATNRNLLDRVRAAEFREDLYYRLNVVPIEVPPLRQRAGDVELLAMHALRRMSARHGKTFRSIDRLALELLDSHDWPGNVRELVHTIERAVVLHDGPVLTAAMLPSGIPSHRVAAVEDPARPAPPPRSGPEEAAPTPPSAILPLAEVERRAILGALEACNGVVPAAAQKLEISAATIYRKLKVFGIDARRLRSS